LGNHEAAARVIGAVGLHPYNEVESNRFVSIEAILRDGLGTRYDALMAQGSTDGINTTIEVAAQALAELSKSASESDAAR
jgi:hypothetical protein